MRPSSLFSFALLSLAACGATPDEAGVDDAAATVHPHGEEGATGLLRVTAPPTATTTQATVLLDDKPVTLGTWAIVAGGTHTLSVNGIKDHVVITPDTPVSYSLSAVRFVLPTTPTLGINAPVVDGDPNKLFVKVPGLDGVNAVVDPTAETVTLLPRLADNVFDTAWAFGAHVSTHVSTSGVVTVDLNAMTGRTVMPVVAPARDYGSGDTWTFGSYSYLGFSSGMTVRVPEGTTLLVDSGVDAGYPLVVAFSLPDSLWTTYLESLRTTGLESLKLGRIDVDDVALKKADGTTTRVHGTFFVRYTDKRKAAQTAGPFETNSGLDVEPGQYRVETHYVTTAGAEQIDVEDVTIP